MEGKSNARTPGKCRSLIDRLYKRSRLEEQTLPYSTAKVERLNRIADYHSRYFQNIVTFDHNHFEIAVTLETFDPAAGQTNIDSLPEGQIERLFVQFIALYETAKSRDFDFIDFNRFSLDPGGNVRFPVNLAETIEPDLSAVLPVFRKHERFKNLHERNYKDYFTDLSPLYKFNENHSYLYRFSDFTTHIIDSYPVTRSAGSANVKIKIKTGSAIQEKIIKINLANNLVMDDVCLITIDNENRPLQDAISDLLPGKGKKEPADFVNIINELKLFLKKSSFASLLLVIDNLKTKEDSEFVNYLLDSSGITDILLIVFGENDFIDFDLELKEKPPNLLEKYLRFYNIEETGELSEREIYLLKVFETIPVPLSEQALPKVFSADEGYIIRGLVKKKYLKIEEKKIRINVNLAALNITLTGKEEKRILELFLDKFDSLNVRIKYFIDAGKSRELKIILKKYLKNRYKFEDGYVSIRRIFFENLAFLRQEIELVRLFADIFIKENDLFSARELIDCCRELDPVFLDLKSAYIYKLERDYTEMARILASIKGSVSPAEPTPPLRGTSVQVPRGKYLQTSQSAVEKSPPTEGERPQITVGDWGVRDPKERSSVDGTRSGRGGLEDEFLYLEFIGSVKNLNYEKAEAYLQKIESELYINLAHIQLSDKYIYNKEYEQAGQLLEQAIAYLGREKYYRDELEAKNQLAKVLRGKKEYDKADTLYKNIFIKSEINNYKLLSGHIAIDIGNLYYFLDDAAQAESWYKKALRIYRQQRNKNGEILAESNLTEISKIKGHWQEAENYLRSILDYDKKKNKIDSLAVDYYNIAHLEYLRHNYTKALEVLETAVSLFEKKENLAGRIESAFLKLNIAVLKDRGQTGTDILEKHKSILGSDEKTHLSLMQSIGKKKRHIEVSQLLESIGAIRSESLRYDILTIIITKYRNPELLDLLRRLSMVLSKGDRDYYYYEYYYIYFNYFCTPEELDNENRKILADVYYFFLRNKRKIAPGIGRLKHHLDEKEASYDLFKSAALVNDYKQWKIPGDMFKSLAVEIEKVVRADLIKLVIYEEGNPLFDFSHPNKYKKMTGELVASAMSLAENLNLDAAAARDLVKSDEKVFYYFKNTKVLLWRISDTLFAVLLLAFVNESYKDYDFLERNKDLLKKFASLIQRYYEVDYKLNSKLDFIIGDSLPMKMVKEHILKVGNVDFPVLITGESGSGKELIAKGVHLLSRRADKSFIPVNSAAIPENLLEAELFGYRKGAFTGANESRTGLIEAAHGGTLFLDEIADLPMSLQAKMLRALQEKEIRRLGENTTLKVDFRLISATNKDLKAMAQDNRFREDLYYRLEVLQIAVPPLRDRLEDIPLLAEYFLKENNFPIKDQIEFQSIAEYLKSREWSGNVRELESSIKRLITYYPDFEIGERVTYKTDFSLKAARDNLEKTLIIKTLKANNWHKVNTARDLKISRMYLFNLIRKYDITKE